VSVVDVIACGPGAMFADECLSCGGWLHREVRGGYSGPNGWRYCSEECAADQQEYSARQHLLVRDLLCDCERVCKPRGLPDAAMRAEYADYLATLNEP